MDQEFAAPDDDQRILAFQPAPWLAPAASLMAASRRLDTGPRMAGTPGRLATLVAS